MYNTDNSYQPMANQVPVSLTNFQTAAMPRARHSAATNDPKNGVHTMPASNVASSGKTSAGLQGPVSSSATGSHKQQTSTQPAKSLTLKHK